MGGFLSAPVTEKHIEEGGHYDESGKRPGRRIRWATAEMQGWRTEQEDAHVADVDVNGEDLHVFCVFDGHGGKTVSRVAAQQFTKVFLEKRAAVPEDLSTAATNSFLSFDDFLKTETGVQQLKAVTGGTGEEAGAGGNNMEQMILKRLKESGLEVLLGENNGEGGVTRTGLPSDHPALDCGCTAVAAVIEGNKLTVANAGDSRCVLSRAGRCVELSFDHKPFLATERNRIERAGGFVQQGRVNGRLNLSRSLGDFKEKDNPTLPAEEQMVTAFPDIVQETLTDEDEFMVLACDGIWDCMSSQAAVDFVRERLAFGEQSEGKKPMPLGDICREMLEACLAPSISSSVNGAGTDNMTIVIALLKDVEIEHFASASSSSAATVTAVVDDDKDEDDEKKDDETDEDDAN